MHVVTWTHKHFQTDIRRPIEDAWQKSEVFTGSETRMQSEIEAGLSMPTRRFYSEHRYAEGIRSAYLTWITSAGPPLPLARSRVFATIGLNGLLRVFAAVLQ